MAKRKELKGVIEAFVEWEVKDKDGKVISKGKMRSGSWVAQFLRYIRRLIITEGTSSMPTESPLQGGAEVVDTTGTAREVLSGGAGGTYTKVDGVGGATDCGLVVGTDDSSVTATQYALIALIAHGSGSGQLSYGGVTIDTLSIVGTTVTLRIIRVFTNLTGATITVREIGIYARGSKRNPTVTYTFMWARDVPSPAITIPAGSSLTLRYILQTTA